MIGDQPANESDIPDDLKQSPEDEAFIDAFVERNRPALEKMIEEARASIARGEGIVIRSYEEFRALFLKDILDKPSD